MGTSQRASQRSRREHSSHWTHGIAESRSLMVKSGITHGVCSMVVLLDEAFVDILGGTAGAKGREEWAPGVYEEPGPSMGSLWRGERGKRGGDCTVNGRIFMGRSGSAASAGLLWLGTSTAAQSTALHSLPLSLSHSSPAPSQSSPASSSCVPCPLGSYFARSPPNIAGSLPSQTCSVRFEWSSGGIGVPCMSPGSCQLLPHLSQKHHVSH